MIPKFDISIDTEKILKGEMARGAVFSDDRRYRYILIRAWRLTGRRAIFVLLNPSKADENQDDPTVRRCISYAKRWGYAGLYLLNIFALRATDPRVLQAPETVDPMGSYNKDALAFIVNHERRQRMYEEDINEIDSIPENQTDIEVLEEVRYQKHAAIRTVELASMEGVKAATKEGRN